MKKSKLTIFLLGCFMITTLTTCEKNSLWVGKTEYIIGTYSNSNGTPFFTIDETSPFLTYNSNEVFTYAVPDTVSIIIGGIQVANNTRSFTIDPSNVIIEECDTDDCRGSDWKEQTEFKQGQSNFQTDVVAVLVLDVSNSLQGNVDDVKDYAKDFAKTVVESSPNSYVGLVLFSDDIENFNATFYNASNLNQVYQNIDNYTNYQDRTTLYGACQVGINMLNNTLLEGSKNLVVFTDGGDNNTDNPNTVKSAIINSGINRFAIGLDGNDFRSDDLEDLASSRANFTVANDINDLQNAFESIGRQIATVYQFVYKRSDQLLDQSISVKFTFNVEK